MASNVPLAILVGFIKGLIVSFNIQNIVNFVMDVYISVEFSVYNCCQMSFSLSHYTKNDVGWGISRLGNFQYSQTTNVAQRPPRRSQRVWPGEDDEQREKID